MKSTAALKAACLSVGLATAWSPLGIQQAHAGTVVNVHLNIGTSSYPDAVPLTFSHLAVGLLNSDDTSFEVHPIAGSFAFDDNTQNVHFDSAFAAEDIFQFVAVGVTPDHHVVVTVADINQFADENDDPITWANVFPTFDEPTVAGQLENDNYSFVSSLLSPPADGVLQDVLNPFPPPIDDNISTFYEFSEAAAFGDVSLDFTSAAVPLPNECLMGGALFATLAVGKHTFRKLRLREADQLV